MTTEPVILPIPLLVTRHQCPFCHKTRSKKTAATAHIARCWQNPATRSCKTCIYLAPVEEGPYPEHPGWPQMCAAQHDIKAGLPSGCPDHATEEPTR